MRRVVLFIALLLLLSTPALAAELDPEQYEAYGAGEVDEAIPDSASEVLGGAGVDDALDTEGMFSRLWDSALDKLGEHFGSAAASAVKLVAIPLGLWVLLRGVLTHDLMLTTLILARAMPAATNSTILCYRYGRDGSLASGCVFLSTLLSLVTIPLVLTMLFAA